jgi:hypothetical protein
MKSNIVRLPYPSALELAPTSRSFLALRQAGHEESRSAQYKSHFQRLKTVRLRSLEGSGLMLVVATSLRHIPSAKRNRASLLNELKRPILRDN